MNKWKAISFVWILLLYSCSHMSINRARPWLKTKMGEPLINVTGEWDVGDEMNGGWGKGIFMQKGSKFSGTMGFYYVEGVVSGKVIHMILGAKGNMYYTARIEEKAPGVLIGYAADGAIVGTMKEKRVDTFDIIMKKAE